MKLFVYYEWSHPNKEQVLYYGTKIMYNNSTVHEMNIPGVILNATCQLDDIDENCHHCYQVLITAYDRCGEGRTNSTNITFNGTSFF